MLSFLLLLLIVKVLMVIVTLFKMHVCHHEINSRSNASGKELSMKIFFVNNSSEIIRKKKEVEMIFFFNNFYRYEN